MSLADLRDIVIIVYGVLGVLLLAVLIGVTLLLWFAIRGLSNKVNELIDDPVRPTLEEVRRTAANVRGTSEFVADTTAHPVIRMVAAMRGARRGIGSLANIRRRSR